MNDETKDTMPPLTPAALHILLALAEGEKHGYGIMQEITAFTDGQFTLGPGTLYRSIKQMLDGGLIQETELRAEPETDDERRRYYALTGIGRRAARAELNRLENLVRVGQSRRLRGEA